MQTRFYICRHCGNVIEKVHDAGVPVVISKPGSTAAKAFMELADIVLESVEGA